MDTLYECNDRECFNQRPHFHSNQCYIGCKTCFPNTVESVSKWNWDRILISLLIAVGLFSVFCFVMAGLTSAGIIGNGLDGTYQRCRIPAPNTSQGFYCDNISREEFLPYVNKRNVPLDDGSEHWYVSFEK